MMARAGSGVVRQRDPRRQCEDGSVEPSDSGIDDRPLYGKRRKRIIRALVLITVGAMLLPALLNLFTVSAAAAARACTIAAIHEAADASGINVPFQFFGPGLIGWECYATGTFGGDRHIISLGLFPGLVALPTGGVET